MPFYKKLLFFSIGIALGLLMVFFLFGNRDIQCAYFPNDRVLYDMRKKQPVFSDLAARKAQDYQLDSVAIDQILHNSKVLFKQSNSRQKPCGAYLLEWEHPSKETFTIAIENCDSTLVFKDFSRN
jgi:hypothetical protein